MKKLITLALCFMLLLTSSALSWVNDDVKVDGEINSWSDSTMSKDDLGTEVWKITIQASADDSSMEYLYQNWSYGNKWTDASPTAKDSVANVTFHNDGGGANDVLANVANGNYYTFRFLDSGYADSKGLVMETSSQPSLITDVSDTANAQREVQSGVATTVTITLNQNKVSEEKIYVRYTSNNWTSSSFVLATGDTNIWEADIPGMTGSAANTTTADYYVLTTTLSSGSELSDNADLVTISFDNNSGNNYALYVIPEPMTILFLLFGLSFAVLRK